MAKCNLCSAREAAFSRVFLVVESEASSGALSDGRPGGRIAERITAVQRFGVCKKCINGIRWRHAMKGFGCGTLFGAAALGLLLSRIFHWEGALPVLLIGLSSGAAVAVLRLWMNNPKNESVEMGLLASALRQEGKRTGRADGTTVSKRYVLLADGLYADGADVKKKGMLATGLGDTIYAELIETGDWKTLAAAAEAAGGLLQPETDLSGLPAELRERAQALVHRYLPASGGKAADNETACEEETREDGPEA